MRASCIVTKFPLNSKKLKNGWKEVLSGKTKGVWKIVDNKERD